MMSGRVLGMLVLALCLSFYPTVSVIAAAGDGVHCFGFGCKAVAKKNKTPSHSQAHSPKVRRKQDVKRRSNSRDPSRAERRSTASAYASRARAIQRRNLAINSANDKAIAAYQSRMDAWERCQRLCSTQPSQPSLQQAALELVEAPIATALNEEGGQEAAPRAPAITPEQAAYMAVARLRFPDTPPSIGPSPKINPWKMAAVGYPLWLWADGPARVGPVADTVADLSVSLDARVTKTTFRMGDGQTVTCAGMGKKWSRAVQPGEESPSCGHTYTKPSLPKGKYTVTATAHWSVTWTINDTSGVIEVPRSSTTQLPVGELQVLTR